LLRLRELPVAARAGLSGVLVTLLGGFAASGAHLVAHHAERDGVSGLSLDDLRGAYRGLLSPSRMLVALEGGHPEDLAASNRRALLAWLRGSRISEDYDNLDLVEAAPAEILARECRRCHARDAKEGEGIGRTAPLEFWDDVKRLAFSRDVRPTPLPILAASTHTHALALGTVTLLVGALAWLTSWPRRALHPALLLLGVSLALDFAAWWLSRVHGAFVLLLAGAGAIYNGLAVLLLLAILVDLWRPAPSRSA
jgi:hypothetical protein